MAPKQENTANTNLPQTTNLQEAIPTTSTEAGILIQRQKSRCKSSVETCLKYLYNKDNKTVCEKTLTRWLMVISYIVVYLVILSTYTVIFLFSALYIIKSTGNIPHAGKARLSDLYNYDKNGVGLTAIPTSENDYALIWYIHSKESNYRRYVAAIDKLIGSRKNATDLVTSLGPCGSSPYGYGDKPCVFVKINKQLDWAGKAISHNSTISLMAPKEVQNWIRFDKKLWLYCDGYNLYDREHIGQITYYPFPPGFDPNVFPLGSVTESPLVALQFLKYTPGVSVDVLCKLWYEKGPSSVHFTLYIEPQKSLLSV